ncbi:MAG: YdcF family protein [Clostridia bacterium]|nr:YdcF family protein [Clostridia bacterium]
MEKTDAILVLGYRLNPDNTPSDDLRSRIDTAVALWKETKAPLIMPCGGVTHGRSRSEAEVMRDMLIERGVPASIIRMEDRSRTTTENIVNAVKLLEKDARVALVTSEYHLEHSLFECERFGINAYGVPAPTQDPVRRERGFEMSRQIMQMEKDAIARGLDPEACKREFFMKMREKAIAEGRAEELPPFPPAGE